MENSRPDISILLSLILVGGFIILYSFYMSPATTEASHLAPAFDWAWSSNVGWISFNCNNSGIGDTCGTSLYRVYTNDVSPTEAQLRGYAWSSNVGWITFEPSELENCPAGRCDARITGTELIGWAKVLSTGEWISFNCANMGPCGTPANADYKVSYDSATGNLSGWAWSSGVMGWVAFSCLNTGSCAVSPHQVRIAPVEEESCQDIEAINFGDPLPCMYAPPEGGTTTTKPIFKEKETVPR